MARLTLDSEEYNGERLPLLCCRCGDNSTGLSRQTFLWYPKWIIVLFFVCLPVFFLVMLLMTKRRTIHLPTCDRHYYLALKRRLLATLGTVIFSGCIIWLSFQYSQPFDWEKRFSDILIPIQLTGIGIGVLLILLSVFASIRAVFIGPDSLTLAGVSQHFADSVEQYRFLLDEFEEDEDRGS
jgi:hypothetical protein